MLIGHKVFPWLSSMFPCSCSAGCCRRWSSIRCSSTGRLPTSACTAGWKQNADASQCSCWRRRTIIACKEPQRVRIVMFTLRWRVRYVSTWITDNKEATGNYFRRYFLPSAFCMLPFSKSCRQTTTSELTTYTLKLASYSNANLLLMVRQIQSPK